MKITVASVAKGGQGWADAAVDEWLKRIRVKWRVDELRIKPAPDKGNIDNRRHLESERLLKRVPKGHFLVALDERGIELSTEEFTQMLSKLMNQSCKGLFFAIGGPFGHHETIRQKSDQTIRLSKMVLNHELARIMLVEQIYRASSLIWGGKYHH